MRGTKHKLELIKAMALTDKTNVPKKQFSLLLFYIYIGLN